MKNHIIYQFEVGPMQNFCYFIGDPASAEIHVVDPGWEADKIRDSADQLGKKISGILCTHSHYDHVDAIEPLLKTHDIPVFMLREEVEYYNFKCENLKSMRSGDKLDLGNLTIEFLHTPGHTVGSTSYRVKDNLITGDTLFVNGCGRCDLLGGDPSTMYATLKGLCRHLPKETTIWPGHDYGPTPKDSLLSQMQNNAFLKYDRLEDFLLHRMKPRKTT